MMLFSQTTLFATYALVAPSNMGIIISRISTRCLLHSSYLTFMNLFKRVRFRNVMIDPFGRRPLLAGCWLRLVVGSGVGVGWGIVSGWCLSIAMTSANVVITSVIGYSSTATNACNLTTSDYWVYSHAIDSVLSTQQSPLTIVSVHSFHQST